MPLMPNGTFKSADSLRVEIRSNKTFLEVAHRLGKLNHPIAIQKAEEIEVFKETLNKFERI